MALFSPVTAVDPHFANVKALVKFESGHLATTTPDLSLVGGSYTATGSAAVTTSSYKWGSASGSFSGGYFQSSTSGSFDFGTSPVTIEAWLYSTNTNNAVVGTTGIGSTGQWALRTGFGGANVSFTIRTSDNWIDITSGFGINDSAWHHVAAVRDGAYMYLYVDGVNRRSYNIGSGVALGDSGALRIGAVDSAFNGYIDDLRITANVARYTADFTPPSSSFGGYPVFANRLDSVVGRASIF